MLRLKSFGGFWLVAFALCFVIASYSPALAQGENSAGAGASSSMTRDEVNYDVQMHLLVASNSGGAVERSNIPSSLDGAVKQLRASLPFTNYRLAMTFLNRVKDGGTLEASGVDSSLFTTPVGPNTPSFYDFACYQVKSDKDANGLSFIRISKFRFSLRLPLITNSPRSEGSTATVPIINYQPVGITTEMSMREGFPTLVGTLTTSRPDELLILLITVKQNSQR